MYLLNSIYNAFGIIIKKVILSSLIFYVQLQKESCLIFNIILIDKISLNNFNWYVSIVQTILIFTESFNKILKDIKKKVNK